MEPKQINCCMPEPMDTNNFGKMVKRNQTLEEGSLSQRGKTGESREKRKELRERNIGGC